jgi:hypothetical protein
MRYESAKLVALAVICGCSLLAFTITDGGKDLVALFVFAVTGLWFLLYWLLSRQKDV